MPDAEMLFVCGNKSVPWDYVSRVSHAVQPYRWEPAQTLALFQAGYGYTDMDYPVNLIREIWKSPASVAEAECTLLKQLWHFKSRKCGDPRDKVFAILAICKDLKSEDVKIDYSVPVAQVYSEVARFIITRDRNLKLLSACQSYGSKIAGLPSWVPDWNIESRYRPTRPISSWIAGDQNDMFSASGSLPARVEFSADLQTMSVQGLLIAKVSALGTHLENDGETIETPATQKKMFSLFQRWWPLAKAHTPDVTPTPNNSGDVGGGGERRFDAFWRTIITDMNSFSQKADPDVEGAQFRSWMALPSTAFEPEDLVAGSNVQENLSFVASFQQATRNRRFLVTEQGQMGLGPRLMRPGDLVCVLLGSGVPFVLREVGGGGSGDGGYELVGECYCHGIMDGEAVRELEGGRVAVKDFEIGRSGHTNLTKKIFDAVRSFIGS